MWASVVDKYQIEGVGEDISMRQYELIVHEQNGTPIEKVFTGEVSRFGSLKNQRPPFDVKNPYLAEITENRELYKGSRSCMHIEVNIDGSKMRYEAGDHIGVYPKNNDDLVNAIGSLLGVDLETIISLKNLDTESSKKHPFPCPTSYRTALQYYVDITNPPRTHILKELSEYTTDEKEKAMLKLMGSSSEEGKALYAEWITKSCRSIVHILEDMPSCKPKLDHLLELLPRVQCRYYSISSSSKIYPSSVHLTAVLIEYETPTKRVNRGVTTSFMKSKKPAVGEVLPVFIRKSQFKLPSKTQVPIIMIGPGTGFAPFRGFLQERKWSREDGKPVGDTILYFGCRKKEEDYLYQEELEGYVSDGTLTKLYTAFSRDQAEKVYVSHLLRANQQEVWDVIGNRNGHVYICGDARSMAKDVRDIILEVISKFGNKSKSEAELFLKRMESQRRYSADVWS
jgi:NADPH-ferrihemoprotein reductase